MITENIWSLPGPRRFVSRILDDLAKGLSIHIHTPTYLAHDFLVFLRSEIRSAEVPTDTISGDGTPLDALLQCLPIIDGVAGLDNLEKCGRRVFLVLILETDLHDKWTMFLRDFSHRTSEMDQYYRPSLIVISNRTSQQNMPDITLVTRSWREVWTDTDSLAVAELFVNGLRPLALTGAVALHLVARLAIWDIELARELSERPVELLTDPRACLYRRAVKNGWTNDFDGEEDSGSVGYVNGVRTAHTSLLIARIPKDQRAESEFARRRWQAQASVLLPWIEEQRQELVDSAKQSLPKGAGDAQLLEVGPLAHYLRLSSAPNQQKRRAFLLRQARNSLAHRNILSFSELRALSDTFDPR